MVRWALGMSGGMRSPPGPGQQAKLKHGGGAEIGDQGFKARGLFGKLCLFLGGFNHLRRAPPSPPRAAVQRFFTSGDSSSRREPSDVEAAAINHFEPRGFVLLICHEMPREPGLSKPWISAGIDPKCVKIQFSNKPENQQA